MFLCRRHVLATGQIISQRALSKDALLFDATADLLWLRGAAIELHCYIRVSVERLDHALQFLWATVLWENLKEAVSAE